MFLQTRFTDIDPVAGTISAMERFFIALAIAPVGMLTVLVYERFYLQGMFGPTSILGALLLLMFSVLLIGSACLARTRFRSFVVNAWMVLVSVFSSYLAVDIVAGALLIERLSPQLVPDEARHHKLVANAYSKFEQQDFSYVQRVNNLGLRGEDQQAEKSPTVYRILTLGDSFTMGKGVEDHQTSSRVLESRLNAELPGRCGPQEVEVLNAGVDSYAPVLEYLYLTGDLQGLDPDMVILNLDVSDLVQESAYWDQALFDEEGNVIAVPGSARTRHLNERVRTWIDQHLYITRLILFYANELMGYRDLSIRGVVTQASVETAKHTLASDTEDRTEQWRKIFASLARIKSYTDGNGMELLLTIYPWGHQVSDRAWIPGRYNFIPEGAIPSDASERTVERLAAEHGIDLLSLFGLFREYSGNEPLYFDHDPHFTATGQRLMGEGIAEHLIGRVSSGCDSARET